MLINALKSILSRGSSRCDLAAQKISFDFANSLQQGGDHRSAIKKYIVHLEKFPLDVDAMNNLACCFDVIGDRAASAKMFEKAFLLDDSNLEVIINYAKCWVDKQRIDECLKYLPQAKAYAPDSPHISAVYASVALAKGDADTARRYALRAWLGYFDNLRATNCYLFYCAYTDMDEASLAAEHRFWGETLLPRSVKSSTELPSSLALPTKTSRIRIGYWSPDFRNHSVRYFVLPLLENHDKKRFEIVAYHDIPHYDAQTDAIKAYCDHFLPVSDLTDDQLVNLIQSHQLDILVELAGHSSANRLNLLQERLATKQITGLGYPPTTGLSTIDAKIIDIYIANLDSARFYTETPLILDASFWCFDPKEKPEICPDPPAVNNGYITFGCVGNIAKITQAMLKCWAEILENVVNSRLLIRSISLNDTVAAQFIADRIEQTGIDLNRVDFFGPAGGTDFFASYNKIDIILDTYPFNGGTTTCFATYMGVPVLSMAGKSLLSRMGRSVLSNLGLFDWIVTSHEEYTQKAILHAQNMAFLSEFRAQARYLYAKSPLGNGKLYAENFEEHCIALLEQTDAPPSHKVDALPVQELINRAYFVLRYGQFEAASRIVAHCLQEYPNSGIGHVLSTYQLTKDGHFVEAAEYLQTQLDKFAEADKFIALLNIARFNMIARKQEEAKKAIITAGIYAGTVTENLQYRMLQAYLKTIDCPQQPKVNVAQTCSIKSLAVVIVCSEDTRYAFIRDRIQATCKKLDCLTINFYQCYEENRGRTYRQHIYDSDDDAMIIIQKNMDVFNKDLFTDIALALDQFDIVGMGGARIWDRIDWRHSPSENKAISYIIPSGEAEDFFEINYSGENLTTLVGNLAILDGNFLAIKKIRLRSIDPFLLFDPMLEGGGILLEEYLTYAAYKANLKLGVHQNLGVILDWRMPMLYKYEREARWHLTQKLSYDPFLELQENRSTISIPVPSVATGMEVMNYFFDEI